MVFAEVIENQASLDEIVDGIIDFEADIRKVEDAIIDFLELETNKPVLPDYNLGAVLRQDPARQDPAEADAFGLSLMKHLSNSYGVPRSYMERINSNETTVTELAQRICIYISKSGGSD